MSKKGFTLIELLIVVAIMAILAAVVFVALDPLTRFKDSRDSVRWQQANEMLLAIKLDQLDHGGQYLSNISVLGQNITYMIGTNTSGCDDYNGSCLTDVYNDTSCVDLSPLVSRGYLGSIPVSPNGNGNWTDGVTGYTLTITTSSAAIVRACENEHSNEIELIR